MRFKLLIVIFLAAVVGFFVLVSQWDITVPIHDPKPDLIIDTNTGAMAMNVKISGQADVPFYIYKQPFEIGAPLAYGNLQLFPIYGTTSLDNKKYITLNDALSKGLVKVYETGNVQELKADNFSDDYIFIHSGDVVKGGRQDRTIRFDVILAPIVSLFLCPIFV